MRVRRKKEAAALEVTAFINLIVVLVPFLLSTAVFTRLAVLDLALPAKSSGGVEQLKVDDLKLEVTLRPDAIEVADRIGGLIERLPSTAQGYDTKALSSVLQQLKERFPQTKAATVLAQPDTPYEQLVHVMDAVREAQHAEGAKILHTELFPEIAIGDAPLVLAKR